MKTLIIFTINIQVSPKNAIFYTRDVFAFPPFISAKIMAWETELVGAAEKVREHDPPLKDFTPKNNEIPILDSYLPKDLVGMNTGKSGLLTLTN